VNADALVCGSDQIWNSAFCAKDDLRRFFFLDFGSPSLKRLSYAASWGAPSLDGLAPSAKDAVAISLKRFRGIRVREKSGVGIAADLQCRAVWHPDPTLLLDSAVWDGLAEQAERAPTPNSLFQCEYRWTSCVPLASVARTLTRRFGWRPVIPFSSHYIRDAAYTQCLTPQEWLNGIRTASFIVTNSFHSMVFSIIFKRPFIVVPLSGKYAGMNERIFSLAERLGLEKRVLDVFDPDLITRLGETPIDWENVKKQLVAWRYEAKSFLTDTLN
jgi:hypothetical protein